MTTSLINTTTIVRALRGELFLKRDTWQAASFHHLLEQYPTAALVLSASSGIIMAVNGPLIKLTEWTRADLLGHIAFQIIVSPDVETQCRTISPGSTKSFSEAVPLRTHSGGTVLVDLKLSAFADDRHAETLLLMLAMPVQERLAKEQEETQIARFRARIEDLGRMINAATSDNLHAAIRAIRDSFLAETAGLYQMTSTPPGFRLEWAEGQTSALPQKLGPSEIQFLTQPLNWNSSQRPEAMLCQVARSNGWSHVLAMPVGEAPDIQGALFVAYRFGNPPPAATTRYLSAAAQQIGHLLKQLQREAKLNDTQRLAVRLSSQMAAINAQVEEGIVILTVDGAIDEINPAAAQMLGYRSEDISGLSYSDVLIADIHIMDAILASLSGTTGITLQGNIFRRGGQAFPASVRIQPLPEYGCVLTLHDTSEEQASRVQREHLDNLAYVGQSTQAFAHEVRGPLNNISLGVQFLQSRLKDADEPLREALGKILTEGNRLSTLMNEMLAWAKPVDPHFEALDPIQMLERLLNRWHSKTQQRNVRVTFVADEDCPPILADALQLERVCVNLIDNALQAMPAGGDLSIRVQAPPPPSATAEQQVLIQVGDSGPGMPEDVRRRVFDPYFTTKPNGTGLGLAICRRLVTVNRGAISVESFPGTGTIFTVTLPACRTTESSNSENLHP
jgi:PAS domain S-box-containing protein